MKKVLITGKHSYIGENILKCLNKYGDEYKVEIVGTKEGEYKKLNFGKYDTVIDVAGIAHVKITPDMESLFYQINRDLAIELCTKAKREGATQFIYLSSMNVYGDTDKMICSRKQENPINFYGKSKLEADLAIHEMSDKDFKVVSVRPPVVYGKGCKGNFNKLIKLSKISPLYPTYGNVRSMIYVENLCEYIREIINHNLEGYFHPQNFQHVTTGQCMKDIREALGKKAFGISICNPMIRFMLKKSHTIDRAFSDDYYAMELSISGEYDLMKSFNKNFMDTIKKTIEE